MIVAMATGRGLRGARVQAGRADGRAGADGQADGPNQDARFWLLIIIMETL